MSEIPTSIAALDENFADLWLVLSLFPTRLEVYQKTRIFKPGTLANLDCQGRGPAGRMHIGGRVCYPRDQVVIWLAGQMKKQAWKHP